MSDCIRRDEFLVLLKEAKRKCPNSFINGLEIAIYHAKTVPATDVIPVDWILNYATEADKDGSVVFSRNHIDTMLEEWRSQK